MTIAFPAAPGDAFNRRDCGTMAREKAKGRHAADLSLASSWRQYIRGRGEDWNQ